VSSPKFHLLCAEIGSRSLQGILSLAHSVLQHLNVGPRHEAVIAETMLLSTQAAADGLNRRGITTASGKHHLSDVHRAYTKAHGAHRYLHADNGPPGPMFKPT
jgi:hypothetical protein